MNGFRDIEQLSAYLDGQLNPSDSARVESRLNSDSELASAYEDIRQARSVIRKLPARKSPRNFTLTRKMVGLKPPLPRAYPTFRFATAFATILFAFTVAVNSVVPRIAFGSAAAPNYGSGGGCSGGCGGGPDTTMFFDAPMLSSAPATEAPAVAAQEMAPAATEESEVSADAVDTERIAETPTTKEPLPESPDQFEGQREAVLIPVLWQVVLASISVMGLLGLFLMSQFAKRKWRDG